MFTIFSKQTSGNWLTASLHILLVDRLDNCMNGHRATEDLRMFVATNTNFCLFIASNDRMMKIVLDKCIIVRGKIYLFFSYYPI